MNLRFYRVKDANEYINQLEAQLAAKGLTPAPATSKPAAPAPKVEKVAPAIPTATPAQPLTAAAKKYLQDYINESNKAKPVIAPPAERLTGADAVRASIRADIAISDLKTVVPVHRAAASPTLGATVTRGQLAAIVKIAEPSCGRLPRTLDYGGVPFGM